MIRLRIMPAGFDLEVETGETVLAAANRAGAAWRSVCGGHAECRTCYFTTAEPDAFDPPAELETVALRTIAPVVAGQGAARLACQARPLRDAALHKVGVRPPQASAS